MQLALNLVIVLVTSFQHQLPVCRGGIFLFLKGHLISKIPSPTTPSGVAYKNGYCSSIKIPHFSSHDVEHPGIFISSMTFISPTICNRGDVIQISFIEQFVVYPCTSWLSFGAPANFPKPRCSNTVFTNLSTEDTGVVQWFFFQFCCKVNGKLWRSIVTTRGLTSHAHPRKPQLRKR